MPSADLKRVAAQNMLIKYLICIIYLIFDATHLLENGILDAYGTCFKLNLDFGIYEKWTSICTIKL